jgi:hypothetical protein
MGFWDRRKVVEGQPEGWKSSEQLESEFRKTHPTRMDRLKTDIRKHQIERKELRKIEAEAYKESFIKARVERKAKQGAMAGGRLPMERIRYSIAGPPRPNRPRMIVRQAPFGPQVYRITPPQHHKKKGKHKKQGRKMERLGFDFDMVDNWGLMK